MIYITQGHEKGIGIEVFLKSFILLPSFSQKKIVFICSKRALTQTLDFTNIPYRFMTDHVLLMDMKLCCHFIQDDSLQSTEAMLAATKMLAPDDILVTLPTSKDQLHLNGKILNGHTEWLRDFYKTSIAMFFKSMDANVLLITDHIPLSEVSSTITKELIAQKIQITKDGCQKYFTSIDEVFIAGINPHSGENGLLGVEEINMKDSKIKFIPADSLLVNHKFKNNRLFVYMYHDQGLGPFKTLFKTIGANISLGLPYLRLSVDHGTAFDLYGKNIADYMGCFYVLKMALTTHP